MRLKQILVDAEMGVVAIGKGMPAKVSRIEAEMYHAIKSDIIEIEGRIKALEAQTDDGKAKAHVKVPKRTK